MKVPRFLGERDVWFAVTLLVLGFLVVFLYLSNHRLINDQRQVIHQQHDALTYLCQTTTTLRLLYEQNLALDRQFLRDSSLSPSVKNIISERTSLETIAISELSRTKACEQIE